jgi:hypothetical protein
LVDVDDLLDGMVLANDALVKIHAKLLGIFTGLPDIQ